MKQVIVVRADLKIGKGKLAGQVAHASISAALTTLIRGGSKTIPESVVNWLKNSNQTKVVLRVDSEQELEEIATKAENAWLPVERIHDAGRTQIEAGTFTAIGIGPDHDEEIDVITGGLKLL